MGNRFYEDMSDEQFTEYLMMVREDLWESGRDATADDYSEMVRRMSKFLEEKRSAKTSI